MSDIVLYFETYWGEKPAEYIAWSNIDSTQSSLNSSNNKDTYFFDGSIRINDSIDFQNGNDKISVEGGNGDAFYIEESVKLSMGNGDDILKSTQTTPQVGASTQHGFYINGSIDMGDGDDLIAGTSILINGSNSLLEMGNGDDTVSAIFYGGTGIYDFGNGIDTLHVKAGTYDIRSTGSDVFLVEGITDPSIKGSVKNLEYFSNGNGTKYNFAEGRIEIKNSSTYDYEFIGSSGNDILKSHSDKNYGKDLLEGGQGDDQLFGYRGADVINGGNGDDLLRAGNGRDVIGGGKGSDTMYGGFGLNTFEDADDGEIDQLFFKSDQHAYNWIYDKAGNSPNGEKADKIMELDPFDEIFVQGVETEELDFGNVVHYSNLGETLEGIGIYASGALEAVYVGDDLSISQIESMTQGII